MSIRRTKKRIIFLMHKGMRFWCYGSRDKHGCLVDSSLNAERIWKLELEAQGLIDRLRTLKPSLPLEVGE